MNKNRYIVEEGSESGHCCFSFTVIDTKAEENSEDKHICECFEPEPAYKICELLNGAE